jgi:putative nucleotidyltransferase with HDIG domain
LKEARDSLVDGDGEGPVETQAVVEAVKGDVGLTIAAVRMSNSPYGRAVSPVGTVSAAIAQIGHPGVIALSRTTETFGLFNAEGSTDLGYERFRSHAIAVQGAADQIAKRTGAVDRDELAIASLLHDIGNGAVSDLWPDRDPRVDIATRSPELRADDERSKLGLDHALVGGVIARRWGLPQETAKAIEGHHSQHPTKMAAHIALADQVAHYRAGDAVDFDYVKRAAKRSGLEPAQLDALLRETSSPERDASTVPCELSARELEVLRKLSEGQVNKQIAADLDLSASTIRSHLHHIYAKMGVVDRAQAVIGAGRLGWI